MQSSISIANTALIRIGVSRFIDSFSEATQEAHLINRIFVPTRQRLLRKLPWAFARQIRKLELTNVEHPTYRYVYRYPDDALRIFNLYPYEGQDIPERFWQPTAKFGYETFNHQGERYIATSLALAHALIVVDVQDSVIMDSLFEDLFAWELAKELAMPLSVSSALAKNAADAAAVAYDNARVASLDERDDAGSGPEESEFVRVRR